MGFDEEFGLTVVQGIAKNVSSSTLSLAQVKVKFYDADGMLIETSVDVIHNLAPGESWKFRVKCYEKNAKSYKIGVGSVW